MFTQLKYILEPNAKENAHGLKLLLGDKGMWFWDCLVSVTHISEVDI